MGNKADMTDKEMVSMQEASALGLKEKILVKFVSAKDNTGIKEVF